MPPRQESNFCIFIGTICCIIIIAGLIALVPNANHLRNHGNSTNNSTSGNQTVVDPLKIGWENDGSGLAITILNSCDDTWTSTFDEYIDKWDNGSPDSLTITTEKRPRGDDSSECQAFTNLVHVCNGNYYYTNWVGVAYLWRDTVSGHIVSVVALLNDYHLEHASANQRKYTMCHELGHVFGLPHTDTNHFNQDLGNCLDYTAEYGNNLNPGQVNFDRLNNLYGSVTTTTSVITNKESLQDHATSTETNETLVPLSMQTAKQYKVVEECLETKSCTECMELLPRDEDNGDTRRMLYQHKLGEACEFNMDAYVIEIHKLLFDG